MLRRVRLADVEAFVSGQGEKAYEREDFTNVRGVLLFGCGKDGCKVFTESLASVREGEVEGPDVLVVDVSGGESEFDDLIGDFSVGHGHVYLLPLDTLENRVKRGKREDSPC